MQVCANNFEQCLAEFKSQLPHAEFVSIDTELTGGRNDDGTFSDSTSARLSKLCLAAEQYGIIQIGLTLISRLPEAQGSSTKSKKPFENVKKTKQLYSCASYNFYIIPFVDENLESLGYMPCLMCSASGVQSNVEHNIDFNAWVRNGVPYVSRENEAQYFTTEEARADPDLSRKLGFLRLWKLLCEAQLPLVMHNSVTLFFLLTAFERRFLPRDPAKLATLALHCFPQIYDTAHIFEVLGKRFHNIGLGKFFEDAKQLSEREGEFSISFELAADTQKSYGGTTAFAHEAGCNSLLTAQLLVYLEGLYPKVIRKSVNRLFLNNDFQHLDLTKAVHGMDIGSSTYNLSRKTLVVAEVSKDYDLWDVIDKIQWQKHVNVDFIGVCERKVLVAMDAVDLDAEVVNRLTSQKLGVLSWVPLSQFLASSRKRRRAEGDIEGV